MGFLSNLFGFENSFSKNFGKDLFSNPTRLLTGIDPASTKLWNTVLGRDDDPLVNWFGSPGQQYYDRAQAEGIDTSAANKFHTIADTVAGIYGGSGLSGSLGFGGLGSASGPSSTSGALMNAGNIGKVANAVAGSGDQNNEGSNMGLFNSFLGSSGGGSGLGGLVAGIGGALLGGAGGGNKSMTTQNQIDPRIASILFGNTGSNGLLSQFQSLMKQPQTLGSQVAGQLSSNYLAGAAPDDVTAIRNASLGLINNQPGAQRFDSPNIANPMWVTGERINAPSQDDLNLSPAFQNFIYGNAAENPYLLRSLGAGVDLASAGFRSNVGDITDALQRNVLPGIRGGAIMSGQYGGSRQGIAEGNALSDFTRQLTNAANQQGLAQTQGILGAQTQTFNQGQDRALAALTNLSGQQFGRSAQEAQMAQQAQLANQAAGNEFVRSNQAAQLQTNALNSQNALQSNAQANAARIAGTGALSGLLGQMYGYNQNAQNADLARAQGVSGLLSPFIGVNQSTTQPVYQNTGANVLGGAAAGLGLYNQFKNAFGSTPTATGSGSFTDAFKSFGYMG